MLDSTAAVAAERQGKNARQLLETVALETGLNLAKVEISAKHGLPFATRLFVYAGCLWMARRHWKWKIWAIPKTCSAINGIWPTLPSG